MIETLLIRWRMLSARERRTLIAGVALLSAVLVWLLLFEPASAGRQRLRAELPELRSQLAQMEQLGSEARQLGAVPVGSDSAQAIQEQLQQSIASAGLAPGLAKLSHGSGLFDLQFKSVPYAAWLAWLDSAVRETRLRVVDAAVTREAGVGIVSARLALELPHERAARRP